eukprot:COSAG06_NODE_33573_length_487_cov_2.706186_1_plen_29_part_10
MDLLAVFLSLSNVLFEPFPSCYCGYPQPA